MRKSLTILAAIVLTTAAMAAHGYVRTQAAWLVPTAGTADAGYGLFTGLGCSFGPGEHHDLGVEIGWSSWELDHTSDYGAQIWEEHADCSLVPVLANYRFRGEISPALAWYVQAGAGVASAKTDIAMSSNQGYRFNGSESDRTAVMAFGAGFSWTLAEDTTVHLGYRYIAVASLELDLLDTDIELSALDSDLHAIEAGLTYRF